MKIVIYIGLKDIKIKECIRSYWWYNYSIDDTITYYA